MDFKGLYETNMMQNNGDNNNNKGSEGTLIFNFR